MKKYLITLLLFLCLGLYGCGCNCSSEDETTTGQHGYTVYITDTGRKYHSEDCSYLTKTAQPIGVIDAKEKGYTPCSRCNP